MKFSALVLSSVLSLTYSLAHAETREEVKPLHKPSFVCPSESEFLETWGKAVKEAKPEESESNLAKDRRVAYDVFFSKNVPNHNLLFNTVEIAGVSYDLTLIRSDYYWNPEYPDAYGVLFQKGSSRAVATFKTDTDRSDYQCKQFLAPTVYLPADEFLSLTIDSPQDLVITIKGETYQHFYVISENLAYAETAENEFVQFVPAK